MRTRLLLVSILLASFAASAAEGDTRIARWKDDTKGVFMITIDDFRPSAPYADTFLANRGLKGIFGAIVMQLVNNPERGQWARDMADNGHEVASHGWYHLMMRDAVWDTPAMHDSVYQEVVSSKVFLDSVLLGHQVVESFLWPYCRGVATVDNMVMENYIGNRNQCWGVDYPLPYNSGHPTGTDFLGVNTTNTGSTTQELHDHIDAIIDSGGWGMSLHHNWATDDSWTRDQAIALCDYMQQKVGEGLLWNPRLIDFVRYARERLNGVVTPVAPGSYDYSFTLSDTLPDDRYSDPLTMFTEVPSGCTRVSVHQNGQSLGVYDVVGTEVMYEVVPDAGTVGLNWDGSVVVHSRAPRPVAARTVAPSRLTGLDGSVVAAKAPGRTALSGVYLSVGSDGRVMRSVLIR